MARQRELLVNIERMRREVDEFFGDSWSQPAAGRRASAFTPRADVYYRRREEGEQGPPLAVVKVELAGVDPDAVELEISGRELVISGSRPVRETEGRAYQQVEIPTGGFRRVIKLGVEVAAELARATFENGILRVELPVKVAERDSRRVPIERAD
ncbi:MAG TPA: Hsp20/alpha crystallin family protein [Solirubrobacterales bacterium]|nr:Hsp20/alpha crystallin family protein [Solirubrobacterales bacterium]